MLIKEIIAESVYLDPYDPEDPDAHLRAPETWKQEVEPEKRGHERAGDHVADLKRRKEIHAMVGDWFVKIRGTKMIEGPYQGKKQAERAGRAFLQRYPEYGDLIYIVGQERNPVTKILPPDPVLVARLKDKFNLI